MGTTYSVVIAAELDEKQLTQLKADIQQVLDGINASMSTYISDSSLSQFNQSRSTEWQSIPKSMVEVISTAQEISRLSNGAFDITVAPVVNLWGFGYSDRLGETPPSSEMIVEALANVGYSRLQIQRNPPALKKDMPAVSIDLSAIAKGYAVDQVAALLINRKLENFLVEIGGELRVSGLNRKGEVWRIAIEKPKHIIIKEAAQIIHLENAAIASSGDYKNYFIWEGKRYSHEINPLTGYPIEHNTALVGVVAENAILADAWATALLILGDIRGLALAQELGLAAYFIVRTEQGFVSSFSDAFAHYIKTGS